MSVELDFDLDSSPDWGFQTDTRSSRFTTWIKETLEPLGKMIAECFDPWISIPPIDHSSRFTILGKSLPHIGIGGINGIATSIKDAAAHAKYLSELANGYSIDWVYNRTHGPFIDLAEAFTINYLGISPNTSELLQESWEAFHLKNIENPDAKFLQFCHSQGAIHVRNALQNLSTEIRDRIIVIAIAPAAIIPGDICSKSFNYANKKDIVHYGELCWTSGFDSTECGISQSVERVLELQNHLVLLDGHPDALGLDHDFQSQTFRDLIQKHLSDYLS